MKMAEDIKDEEMQDDEIIVMVDEDGKEVEFNHIATLDYNNEWYIYVQPVELGDMDDDEMFIFKIEEDENGNDLFTPVEDEDLLDALYQEYLKECDLQDAKNEY